MNLEDNAIKRALLERKPLNETMLNDLGRHFPMGAIREVIDIIPNFELEMSNSC